MSGISLTRPLACALSLLGLAGGCSPLTAPSHAEFETVAITSAHYGRRNGAPISLTPARLQPSLARLVPRGVAIYSLFYWSRGLRCQAYLDVPAGRGPHPLLVELHGGYIFA